MMLSETRFLLKIFLSQVYFLLQAFDIKENHNNTLEYWPPGLCDASWWGRSSRCPLPGPAWLFCTLWWCCPLGQGSPPVVSRSSCVMANGLQIIMCHGKWSTGHYVSWQMVSTSLYVMVCGQPINMCHGKWSIGHHVSRYEVSISSCFMAYCQ